MLLRRLPYSYTIADLDGDGRLDVVASTTEAGGHAVGVLRGNAQGTFDAAVYYPTTAIGPVAVGDVTGDGKARRRRPTAGSVCVLAGNAQVDSIPRLHALAGNLGSSGSATSPETGASTSSRFAAIRRTCACSPGTRRGRWTGRSATQREGNIPTGSSSRIRTATVASTSS
jgi:hypothetical protein